MYITLLAPAAEVSSHKGDYVKKISVKEPCS
jgi:hypothetical protein